MTNSPKHLTAVCIILFASFILVFSAVLAVSIVPYIIGNGRGLAADMGSFLETLLMFIMFFVFIPTEKKITEKTGIPPLLYNIMQLAAAGIVSAVSLLSADSLLAMIEPTDPEKAFFMDNFLLGFGLIVSIYELVGGFVIMIFIRLIYELVLTFRK